MAVSAHSCAVLPPRRAGTHTCSRATQEELGRGTEEFSAQEELGDFGLSAPPSFGVECRPSANGGAMGRRACPPSPESRILLAAEQMADELSSRSAGPARCYRQIKVSSYLMRFIDA